MSKFVDGIEFVTEHCCNCGMPFAMTRDYQKRRLNDRKAFYCPAGHGQHYTGMSEEQKLKQQIERERQMREAAEARSAKAEQQRSAITKAHQKMRTRVMNGVCPCCNRTFQNLMRHMQSEHAGEFNLRNIREAYGMTQGAIADEIGVNTVYISLFEREKTVPEYAKTAIDGWIAEQVKP